MTKTSRKILYILTILALIAGYYNAVRLFWVSDDAFVSYRYALNLVEGRGLVFNPGERVEGFTNFLWVLLQIPGMLAGLDPIVVSNLLSLIIFGVLLLCIAKYGRVIAGPGVLGRLWPTVPLSLGPLALHKHMQIFATSGLETMLFTCLVTVGVLQLLRKKPSNRNGFIGPIGHDQARRVTILRDRRALGLKN